jgi:hypothetical protein
MPPRPCAHRAVTYTASTPRVTRGAPHRQHHACWTAPTSTLGSPSHNRQLAAQLFAAAATNPTAPAHSSKLAAAQRNTNTPQSVHVHNKQGIRNVYIYELVDKSVCQLHGSTSEHADAHGAHERPAPERRPRHGAHARIPPLVVPALRPDKVNVSKVPAPPEVLK